MQEIIPDWQDSLTTVIWIVCEIRPQFAGLVYIVSSTDNCSPPPETMEDPDSDLSQLDVLTEDSILEAVKTRYQKGKIYVSLSSYRGYYSLQIARFHIVFKMFFQRLSLQFVWIWAKLNEDL